MKKVRVLFVILCATFLVFGMVAIASAWTIDASALDPQPVRPSADPYSTYAWGYAGDQSSTNDILGFILGPILQGYSELYKENSDGTEDGSLQDSYDSTITSNGATIEYTGGPYITAPPVPYILVKDGKALPNWYLIKLEGGNPLVVWDGKETITLTNFFLDTDPETGNQNGGSISHVSLFGVNTMVPEPGTLLLLGLGLVGLAGLRRKF